MNAQSSPKIVKDFMRAFVRTKPLVDSSGALIFKYGNGIYYLMVTFAALLILAVTFDPPTKPENILTALLLIGSAIFMSIQSKKYHLLLNNNSIVRNSPWPWHKHNVFDFKEISSIDIKYRAMHVSLMMNDERELEVPIMLNGSFQLLYTAVHDSNATVTNKVRTIIEYYSRF